MNLIEKIVNEILNNVFYAFGVAGLIVILCALGNLTYREKLDQEIKLAQIAAGHFECDCGCKTKCK
jgi:hypothetical protein